MPTLIMDPLFIWNKRVHDGTHDAYMQYGPIMNSSSSALPAAAIRYRTILRVVHFRYPINSANMQQV